MEAAFGIFGCMEAAFGIFECIEGEFSVMECKRLEAIFIVNVWGVIYCVSMFGDIIYCVSMFASIYDIYELKCIKK